MRNITLFMLVLTSNIYGQRKEPLRFLIRKDIFECIENRCGREGLLKIGCPVKYIEEYEDKYRIYPWDSEYPTEIKKQKTGTIYTFSHLQGTYEKYPFEMTYELKRRNDSTFCIFWNKNGDSLTFSSRYRGEIIKDYNLFLLQMTREGCYQLSDSISGRTECICFDHNGKSTKEQSVSSISFLKSNIFISRKRRSYDIAETGFKGINQKVAIYYRDGISSFYSMNKDINGEIVIGKLLFNWRRMDSCR